MNEERTSLIAIEKSCGDFVRFRPDIVYIKTQLTGAAIHVEVPTSRARKRTLFIGLLARGFQLFQSWPS